MPDAIQTSVPPPPRPRMPAVDAARAACLLAMACYHATWDLGFLRLTPENYALTPAGRASAMLIAGAFLSLVGLGLVLMNGRGLRPRPTLIRLARIGGAALLVTAGTWVAFPESYVFFGVLHCIAVSSVLGLPFLFLPLPVGAVAAVAVLAAPLAVHAPVLDAPALYFLGLGAGLPRTNDYVPLFPWFGIVLAGLVAGRIGVPRLAASRLGAWRPGSRFGRTATRAGRHSLAVYLVHQPVLLGLLTGLVWVTGPNPRAGLKAFRADFGATCLRTGGEPAMCRIAARCTGDALVREDLFRDDGRPFTLPERARAQELARGCYAALDGARVR